MILDQILRGELGLGSVVSRRGLGKQFGMSLVPVAEALQRLEIEGLLESRPRAGTRVKVPSPAEVRERFELREALECQSARLCAERASLQERLELVRVADNVDAVFANAANGECDRDYLFAVQKYHIDLHSKIAEYARSRALSSAIEMNHVLIFNWLYDTTVGRHALPPHFHRSLIDVIVKGDPQKAQEEMRSHVSYGRESTEQAVEPLQAQKWRQKRSKVFQLDGSRKYQLAVTNTV